VTQEFMTESLTVFWIMLLMRYIVRGRRWWIIGMLLALAYVTRPFHLVWSGVFVGGWLGMLWLARLRLDRTAWATFFRRIRWSRVIVEGLTTILLVGLILFFHVRSIYLAEGRVKLTNAFAEIFAQRHFEETIYILKYETLVAPDDSIKSLLYVEPY